MDQMIHELLDIDRLARERIESASAWRDEQLSAIAGEKDRLEKQSSELRVSLLRQFDLSARDNHSNYINRLEQSHQSELLDLEQRFADNRKEWKKTLFNRVTAI